MSVKYRAGGLFVICRTATATSTLLRHCAQPSGGSYAPDSSKYDHNSHNTADVQLACFLLHVAHLNMQGLLGNSKCGADFHDKLDELQLHLSKNDAPHILSLNETWLSGKIDSCEIEIGNYHLVRRDRKLGERGGVDIHQSDFKIYRRVC